jgi:Protein of unknown function (DUF2752)
VLARARAAVTIDVSDARGAALAMLAAGAMLPLLPGHPGVPCPLRTLTGVPCPLCGMTTSVEATLHGHPLAALGANPAGPLAVLAAVALLVHRPTRGFRVPLAVVLVVLAAMWLFELHRFALI